MRRLRRLWLGIKAGSWPGGVRTLAGDLRREVRDFRGDLIGGFERVDQFVGLRILEAAKAALALLVGGNRFEQMRAAEVGPEAIGDEDFGVGNLPEQEVRDALLTR